jgi:Big-like domain-containing protein
MGYLQPMNLIARISSLPSGSAVPDGPVQFADGETTIGTATLSSGVGLLVVNGLASGEHHFKTVYANHGTFSGAASAPVTVTVQTVDTSTFTLLIPWRNAQAAGQASIFSAVVLALEGRLVSGAVQFTDVATTTRIIGTVSVVNGAATLTTSLAPGLHLIGARYLGADGLAASSAAPVVQTVYLASPPASTSLMLATSSSPSTLGQPVTFTATLASGTSGTVYFFSDGILFGSADVSDVEGAIQAVFTPSGLSAGVHVISAAYLGNGAFASSNAPLIGQLVQVPGSSPGTTDLLDLLIGRR